MLTTVNSGYVDVASVAALRHIYLVAGKAYTYTHASDAIKAESLVTSTNTSTDSSIICTHFTLLDELLLYTSRPEPNDLSSTMRTSHNSEHR